jgi:hypothetical protein
MVDIKHKDKQPLDLVHHLFHGTRVNTPESIYGTEDGLDMRYSNDGLNGFGIYFADNAKYSNDYAHLLPLGHELYNLFKDG